MLTCGMIDENRDSFDRMFAGAFGAAQGVSAHAHAGGSGPGRH
jgi:hypothetical protein